MITPALIRAVAPTCDAATWAPILSRACDTYEITTVPRIAAFIATTAHESGGFRALSENLNYSAEALVKTWPGRFDLRTAQAYARQPERIANRAYANRMGNGSEASGDGWRYRGAGLIQITGKSNHEAVARAFAKATDIAAAWMRTAEGAAISAVNRSGFFGGSNF